MSAKRNDKIKKANQELEYTPEQMAELHKCSKDPVYFAKTYVKIQHPKRGAIPFELYDYQIDLFNSFQSNRYSIILSARQTGKSICSAIYLLWFAMFHFDKRILIASNKNKGAMEMISRIAYAYQNMPVWLKPGVTDTGWNKHAIEFDNGSKIESTATSEDSGRGDSISLLYLDEFAFVKPSIQSKFWTSILPTLSTGGGCIMSSTPNGDSDLFATLWRSAEIHKDTLLDDTSEDSLVFTPIYVPWDAPPGRDELFKKQQIALIGESKWRQEYNCEFLSSDALLIDSVFLSSLTAVIDSVELVQKSHGFVFWSEIKKDTTYVIGVDPSTGTGNDFSVIQLFEFPAMTQVAEYRSNTMSSGMLYKMLKGIIFYLEKTENVEIYYSIENNGVGEGLLALYENDENPPNGMFVKESGKERNGFTTTTKNKMRSCLTLKEMLERGTMTIKSRVLLSELKSYTRKGVSYSAQSGSSDDSISAVLIIIRILESISSYDVNAHNALYDNSVDGDWWDNDNDNGDGEEPLPMVF